MNRKMKLNSGYTPYTVSSPYVNWVKTFRNDVQVSTATLGATYTVTITLVASGASGTATITAASGTASAIASQLSTAIGNNLPAGWRGDVQWTNPDNTIVITSPDDFTVTIGTRLTKYTRTFWLGDNSYENRLLNYCQSIGIDWVQLYGLYDILDASDSVQKRAWLARFIEKCKLTYSMKRVGAILGDLNGFQLGFGYNSSQVSSSTKFNDWNLENEFWFGCRVDFTIGSTVVIGTTYNITITYNGTPYSFTFLATTTSATDVAQQLYNRMVGVIPGFLIQISGTTIRVYNRGNLLPFTWTFSPIAPSTPRISAVQVNLDFASWVSLATYIKVNSDPINDARTCYIANPLSSWTSTDAQQFVGLFSQVEITNYTTLPDERHGSLRNNQMIPIAAACAATGLSTLNFTPLHSAEAAFQGPYMRTNTIVSPPTSASEKYWLDRWNTDTFANKSRLSWQGYTYFVFKEFYTAPSIQF